jgi:hypothetical protein
MDTLACQKDRGFTAYKWIHSPAKETAYLQHAVDTPASLPGTQHYYIHQWIHLPTMSKYISVFQWILYIYFPKTPHTVFSC